MKLKEISTLYHESTSYFKKISLEQSKPFKDFGKGFYLTTNSDQAIRWGKNRANSYQLNTYYLYKYSVSYRDDYLKVKELLQYNQEWLDFIAFNRYYNAPNEGCQHFDVIYDRIADNRKPEISGIISTYWENSIPVNEAIERLKWYTDDGDQYCFRTPRSLEILTLEEILEFDLPQTRMRKGGEENVGNENKATCNNVFPYHRRRCFFGAKTYSKNPNRQSDSTKRPICIIRASNQ